jgi:hypothetical protein
MVTGGTPSAAARHLSGPRSLGALNLGPPPCAGPDMERRTAQLVNRPDMLSS